MNAELKQIEQEYDKSSHSPSTGTLYMPSRKWGGWLCPLANPETRHSFGSAFSTTKTQNLADARVQAMKFKATVYLFKRGTPCKLVAKVWLDAETNQVKEELFS